MNIKTETQTIIELNRTRTSNHSLPYNPQTGEGSLVGRFRLQLTTARHILMPNIALSDALVCSIVECGTLKNYANQNNLNYKSLERSVSALRLRYDFEYWAISCVKIQDKSTKQLVPFRLRGAQLKLLLVLYNKIEQKEPIRVVLLKARQWGGSTLIQIFMAWIQLLHRRNWHSAIVTDVEEQARNIRAMYNRLVANYPQKMPSITMSNYEGSSKNKIITSRGAIIYIGSMQQPDSLRSSDIMMAHLSEVGLWKTTQGKSPEDLIQTIAGTVPLQELSMIVVESTAKGVGNYFHRLFSGAQRGENGFTPVFVPWYEIDLYQTNFESEQEMREFVESMNSVEKGYFELGASLEGINWHRTKRLSEGYDDWRMGCEFPTTPSEAFQSTGRRAHNPAYTAAMRKECRKPIFVGEISSDSQQGSSAIDCSMKLYECAGGTLWIWALAEQSPAVKNRYIVSMDIGGRTERADYSVISVIDRYGLIEGGGEECIATWRFHLDQDLAIWRAVQLATLYGKALLVVEANSLNAKSSDGDHSLTILDEIKDIYPNLYARSDRFSIREGRPARYGFFTSSASKTDLVNQMNKRMRERNYIEYDERAIDEADSYEIKENGSYGAVDGKHDDIYMSRAIGLKASQVTDPPSLIVPPKKRTGKRVSSESTF